MEKILLVDDDLELCDLLREYLEAEGFSLDAVHDGRSGVDRALQGRYALAVLDIMLPVMGGFDVLREIRSRSSLPVLMLTARGDDIDRIVGLEMGADDYLPKPFNPRELVARIRAVLRRGRVDEGPSSLLSAGDLELDGGARAVRVGGQPLELTSVEFNLLETLLRSAGQVVAREKLVLQVLKRPYSPFDRSIDVHVSNLRKKLGSYGDGSERIKTLRGEGYFFALPPEGA
ncbi:response regulator transcription factor [Aminithiophilus ramosus]|uniref:Response regulator transcription factor n=1 Tax=Aminithiophilus ramosus TaxID=3029084 RepID=A0A9Q7ANB1_9BACT|nr:response regulator transcription factor [Aminithiophilus ramosus]QTX32458.1 response regulator transcription factor [Aminithiophilus ramosus]